MKAAVIGSTGFLGGHLTRRLREGGAEVYGASRRIGLDATQEQPLMDFLDRVRPDVVFNCAADAGGIAYYRSHPVETYEQNLLLGFNLVRCVQRCRVPRLINILPNSVYPGEAAVYREDEFWDGPIHPTMLAPASARQAARVQAWAYGQQGGGPTTNVVLPNMYGPGDHTDPQSSHALMALIVKVAGAKHRGESRVEIWGTGAPVREWIYVEDAVEGLTRAASLDAGIEMINLGRGEGQSIRELAEHIRAAIGWGGDFTFDANRPDGAPRKIMEVGRMRRLMNWEPPTGLAEGIRRTVAWYLASVAPEARAD